MPLGHHEFHYIRDLVRDRSAVVLEPGKEYLIISRLEPLAAQEGFSSINYLIDQLRRSQFGPLHRKVVEAMTTNETSFFRDNRPFDLLKNMALPEILKNRATERTLNVWCAACSSGQEPYSVAILLREHFPWVFGWDVHLIGSDLSTDMLVRAKEGRYSQLEVTRGISGPLLGKYFRKQNGAWQLAQEVRRMVEFKEINLIEPWPSLPFMDIIMMRNVLIYFSVEIRKTILSKVRRLLKPDGYLMLGGAESTVYLDDTFEPIPVGRPALFRLRPLDNPRQKCM